MTILGISDNVQILLEDHGIFTGGVIAHPPTKDDGSELTGFPGVFHYYDDTQGDYATVSQNRRIIVFQVVIVYAAADTVDENEKYRKFCEIMDTTIHMFDVSYDLSKEDINLAPACDIMRPAPGKPERVSFQNGTGWMGTISLYCEKDIQFTDS